MTKPSWIYVLVEDERQRQFIYRFLATAGCNLRQISFELSPSGQGSGEQWVRENFARLAKKCRARNARHARESTGMFVMLDADKRSVQQHLSELDAALVAEGQPKHDSTKDAIARLIPKWSIETWILFLVANGASKPLLSEDESYKNSNRPEQWTDLIPQAAKTLFAWTRTGASRPGNLLDSLKCGLDEIPRALLAGR
jgi:hypothetical protein